MTEKQQFNIYLRPDLIRRVKHASIEKDQSLSVFVEEALAAALDRPAPASNPLILMPIVYVRDMAASLAFYRGLGLSIRHEGDTWSELGLGDAVLALHRADIKPAGAAPIALAFVCREPLERLVQRLRVAGSEQQLEVVDEAYGRSVLLHDPDGHPVQINEHDPELHNT